MSIGQKAVWLEMSNSGKPCLSKNGVYGCSRQATQTECTGVYRCVQVTTGVYRCAHVGAGDYRWILAGWFTIAHVMTPDDPPYPILLLSTQDPS